MRSYVEAAARHDNVGRTQRLLDRIVPDARLHARFVNTLARMEYVGVRKILKSRRAERLDLDGIQHILDEAVHALRLKKAAAALGQASGAGPHVRQQRHAGRRRRRDVFAGAGPPRGRGAGRSPADSRAEANYLLTSAAIEVRARCSIRFTNPR